MLTLSHVNLTCNAELFTEVHGCILFLTIVLLCAGYSGTLVHPMKMSTNGRIVWIESKRAYNMANTVNVNRYNSG